MAQVGTPVHILKRDEGKPLDSWWTCSEAEWAEKQRQACERMRKAANRLYKGHTDEPRRDEWQ